MTENGAKLMREQLESIAAGNETMLRSLLIAAGLEKASIFKVVTKVNQTTKKEYKVITIEGAKVQFGGKTARLMLDHFDELLTLVDEHFPLENQPEPVKVH